MSGVIILLLAAVFALAGVSKLGSPGAFRAVLRGLLPAGLVAPVAILVPVVELTLVVFLVSGITPRNTVAAAVAMLVVFTIVLAEMWRRGMKGCACFGESLETATTGSGVVRNLGLITAGVFVAIDDGAVVLWGPNLSHFLARLTVVVGTLALWPCLVALVERRKWIFHRGNTNS